MDSERKDVFKFDVVNFLNYEDLQKKKKLMLFCLNKTNNKN